MSGKAVLPKALKALHIILASGIIGGLAAILALLGLKGSLDPAAYATADRGGLSIFRWLITYPSFGFVMTSCLYGLFFGWGILRFGWVALKWLLIVEVFAIAWFGLGRAVSGLSSVSDAGFHITSMAQRYRSFGTQAAATAAVGLGCMITAILFQTGKARPSASSALWFSGWSPWESPD